MRRLVLCFLLFLMPLRLWAGVWMPMAPSALQAGLAQVAVTAHLEVETLHDCHEAQPVSLHDAYLPQPETLDLNGQKADCHDATCQLCGVCHQSANLAVWPVMGLVFQAHPQPVGATLVPIVRTAPPLIKPPIF
jgi:hypothetical protein